jgi:hypothetical protein
MLALLIAVAVAAVLALPLGAAVGWRLRGEVGRWCRCGDVLRCPTCSPSPIFGRAAVPMRQPAVPTVDKPLMTRAAENRALRYRRRSV